MTGITAIMYASYQGHDLVVRALLKAGVFISEVCRYFSHVINTFLFYDSARQVQIQHIVVKLVCQVVIAYTTHENVIH